MSYHIPKKFKLYLSIIVFGLITSSAIAYIPPNVDIGVNGVSGGFVELVPYNGTVKSNYLEINKLGLHFSIHNVNNNQLASQGTGKVYVTSGNSASSAYVDLYASGFCPLIQNQMLSNITYDPQTVTLNFQSESGGSYTMYSIELKGLLTLVEQDTYEAAQEITSSNPLTVNSGDYTIKGYCNNGNEAYVSVTYDGNIKEIPVGEGVYSNFINLPAILINMSIDQSTGNITLTFTNGNTQIITESYLDEVFGVGGESASIYTGITYPINDNYQLYVDKSGDVCVIYTKSETYPINYALAFNLSNVYGSFTLELANYVDNAWLRKYLGNNILLATVPGRVFSFPFYSPSTDTLLYPIDIDGYMGVGFSALNNENNYMYYTKSNILKLSARIPITENFIVSIEAYNPNTQQIYEVASDGVTSEYTQTNDTILAFGCLNSSAYLAYPYPNTNSVITNLTSEGSIVGIYSYVCDVENPWESEGPVPTQSSHSVYLSTIQSKSWTPPYFGPAFYAFKNVYNHAANGATSNFYIFPWLYANQAEEQYTQSSVALISSSIQNLTTDGYFGFPPVLSLPTNQSDLQSLSKTSYLKNEFIGSLFGSNNTTAFVILNQTVLWISENGTWTVIGTTADWGNSNIASVASGNVDDAELTITTLSGQNYKYIGHWSGSSQLQGSLSGSWTLVTVPKLANPLISNSSLVIKSLKDIPSNLIYQTGAGNVLVAGNNYAQNYKQPFSTVNYAYNVPNTDRQIIILSNGTMIYHSSLPVQTAWEQSSSRDGTSKMSSYQAGGKDSRSYILPGLSTGDKIITVTPSTLKNGNQIIYILAQTSSGSYYLIISSWFEAVSFSSTKFLLNITDPSEISFNGYLITLENSLSKSVYNINANSTGFTATPINLEALNISKYKMSPKSSTTPLNPITNSSKLQFTNLAGIYQLPWTLGYLNEASNTIQKSYIVPANLNTYYGGYMVNGNNNSWLRPLPAGSTLIPSTTTVNSINEPSNEGDLVYTDLSVWGHFGAAGASSNVYFINGGLYYANFWANDSNKSVSDYTIVTQNNWNQLFPLNSNQLKVQVNVIFNNNNYYPVFNSEFSPVFNIATLTDTEVVLTSNSDSELNIITNSYTDSYLSAVSTLYSIDKGDYSDTTYAVFGTSVLQLPTEANQLSIENGGIAWCNGNEYGSLNFYIPQYYVPVSVNPLNYIPTVNQSGFIVPNGLNNNNEYANFGNSNNYLVALPANSKLIVGNEGNLIWNNNGTNSPVYFSAGGLYYESNSPMPMSAGNIGNDYTIVTKSNWDSLLGLSTASVEYSVTFDSQTFRLNFPDSMSSNSQVEKEYYTENGEIFALAYLYNGTTYSPWTYCFFENNGTYNNAVIILKPYNNIIVKNGIISYLNQLKLTESILQIGSTNSMFLPIVETSTASDSETTN